MTSQVRPQNRPHLRGPKASDTWLKAREQVEGMARIEHLGVYAPVIKDQPYQTFLNCPDDAFNTAERTLKARLRRYGAGSAAVKEWLAAQDQVFANCEGAAGAVPAVLESTDPLLRADRNYQIAAALFYQRRFDEAATAFDTVAKDKESAWVQYGEYLAARAIVREDSVNCGHAPGRQIGTACG
jgi:hypothetical protein